MISIEQARQIIFEQQLKMTTECVELESCCGRIIAEPLFADRDMPPFHRVSMDGIAIKYEDFERGIKKWLCIKTQYAGEAAITLNDSGQCIEVMTGAVLPVNCDTVIRYEDLDYNEDEKGEKYFTLKVEQVKLKQNVHAKGSDKKKGEMLIPEGQLLNATDIGLLATTGNTQVLVYKKLQIAIIATGDELTSIHEKPAEFQIRASNSMMIAAALLELGIDSDQYLVRDEIQFLHDILKKSLNQYDVIVMTGAVSKGKADFIPAVLADLKVEKLFHGVAQRPAKPFWFGKKENTLVFAMPGNPVSAAVCLYVYLIPFIKKHLGISDFRLKAKVATEVSFLPQLTYFMQVKLSINKKGELIAEAFQGNGSGDLTNLSEINALLVLPMHEEKFIQDHYYDFYLTRNVIYEQRLL